MSAFRSTRNFYDTVLSWITNEFTTNPDEVPPSLNIVATVADEVTVVGKGAHDAVVSGAPVYVAGKASAAAPADVSGDGDAAGIWVLRSGAQAMVLTVAGALVGGGTTSPANTAVGMNTRPIPRVGTFTDRSGTITAGAASQEVMAANAARQYLFFQNVSDEDQWINFGTAAVANQPSIKVTPGGSFVMESGFINTGALNVIGTTTGKAFTAKEV